MDGRSRERRSDPQGWRARRWRIALVALILVSCVGCDQVTKAVAQRDLAGVASITYLSGIVRLQYTENPGAFLGIGSGLPADLRVAILTGLASLVLALVFIYALVARLSRPVEIVSVALVLAGGVGNLVDRIRWGVVRDFVSLGFGDVRTGIFNVADVAITVGLVLFLLLSLSGGVDRERRPVRIALPEKLDPDPASGD